MNLLPGSQRITTSDSVIGTSGKPIRLYMVHVISGATASVLTLRNGTTTSDAAYCSLTGTADTGATFNFAGGLRFPNGLFADVDANISSAVFTYTEEF